MPKVSATISKTQQQNGWLGKFRLTALNHDAAALTVPRGRKAAASLLGRQPEKTVIINGELYGYTHHFRPLGSLLTPQPDKKKATKP